MEPNLSKDINQVRTDVNLLNAAISEKLLIAEKNSSVIRSIVIAFCTLVFFLMPQQYIISPLAYILLGIIWLYGAATLIWEPYRKFSVFRASWFTYCSDGLVTSLWIYATGGYFSPFYLIFYASILAVAYRFSTRVTLFTAILYTVIYFAQIALLGQLHNADIYDVLARTGFIFILGFFTNLITVETLKQAKAKLQMKELADKANAAETNLRQLYNELEAEYGQRAQELEKSLARFEALIEAIPQMAWTAAPNGEILYLNKAWYDFTGAKQLKDWKWEEYVCPEDLDETSAAWKRALETGKQYEIEYRWIRHDGEAIWMLGRANPIRNEHGEIELWIGTATNIHEQKQTEEKLKLLSNITPLLVWTTDAEGYHNYFNQRWTEYTGLSSKESLGTEVWNKVLHPDDRKRARQRWQHSLETNEPYEIEYRFRSKEGSYMWFLARAMPLLNREGKTLQWFGSCTDIHDHKIKENTLRLLSNIAEATREIRDPAEIMALTTRMLSEHMQTTRCAYAEVEEDEESFTIINDWSPTTPSTTGRYKLSAFGPQAEEDLRAGKDLVINDVDRELRPETGADTFNAILIKAIICCPLIKEGRLVALMAVHQDKIRYWTQDEITLVDTVVERCWSSIERARSETKLRILNDELESRVLERTKQLAMSEERFRLLAENASDVISRTTPDGVYLYISPSVETMLGYKPEEMIGQNRSRFILPSDIEELNRHLVAGNHSTNKLATIKVKHKEGHFIYMEVAMREVRNLQTGEIIELHSVGRDITLRKQAEETLIKNNQELEQFAYVASHDMKEPLRMISSYTQLLLRKIQSQDEDVLVFSKYISEGVARMQALITDLLDYSRIGRQEVKYVHTNAGTSINAVLNSLGLLIQEAGAKIHVSEMPVIRAIPSLLHQLFQNLIENAIKFRKPGIAPFIEIGVIEQESDWLFRVSDNGIGIDPKYADKVFIIFQRLHNREQFAGTGIGLAVCKKIVELHGGSIWLQSTPGEGTSFYFTFPKI